MLLNLTVPYTLLTFYNAGFLKSIVRVLHVCQDRLLSEFDKLERKEILSVGTVWEAILNQSCLTDKNNV